MTCIAAYRYENHVVMAADSNGVAGSTVYHRSDEKIFWNGPFLIGYTSSYRMAQLIRYKFKPPTPPKQDSKMFEYMVTEFVEELRKTLKSGGFSKIDNNTETGGTFMVAIRHHLFSLDDDFQVGMLDDCYHAVGSGQEVALGALHLWTATQTNISEEPAVFAVRAAIHHITTVGGDVIFKSTKKGEPHE